MSRILGTLEVSLFSLFLQKAYHYSTDHAPPPPLTTSVETLPLTMGLPGSVPISKPRKSGLGTGDPSLLPNLYLNQWLPVTELGGTDALLRGCLGDLLPQPLEDPTTCVYTKLPPCRPLLHRRKWGTGRSTERRRQRLNIGIIWPLSFL